MFLFSRFLVESAAFFDLDNNGGNGVGIGVVLVLVLATGVI